MFMHVILISMTSYKFVVFILGPRCQLQAQTPEDKEAWIKALSEGINKAKNTIFDEVLFIISHYYEF